MHAPEGKRRRRVTGLVATIAVLVAGVLVGLLVLRSGSQPPRSTATEARVTETKGAHAVVAALPPPARGFSVPRPQVLSGQSDVTRWAPVLRAVTARQAPSLHSPDVASVGLTTPEGTANLIDADGEVTRGGITWVRTRLAVLPDDTLGWLPRSALGGWSFVHTRVVVDRVKLTLTLYRGGRQVFQTPVGVGKPSTPTPAGSFYVRDRLTRYASPEYGPIAFGTSARSPFVTDWPAGGFIGIHGTDAPNLIPGRVSHGCIRLRNSAILALAKLMPVGTPVTVR